MSECATVVYTCDRRPRRTHTHRRTGWCSASTWPGWQHCRGLTAAGAAHLTTQVRGDDLLMTAAAAVCQRTSLLFWFACTPAAAALGRSRLPYLYVHGSPGHEQERHMHTLALSLLLLLLLPQASILPLRPRAQHCSPMPWHTAYPQGFLSPACSRQWWRGPGAA